MAGTITNGRRRRVTTPRAAAEMARLAGVAGVEYGCPYCGKLLLITDATDGTVHGVYCRGCNTRRDIVLRSARAE